jgi:superfamily II DNA helicase RecQ
LVDILKTAKAINSLSDDYSLFCAIVYCLSKNECESVASGICKSGLKAAPYHASMDNDDRKHVQALWHSGKIEVKTLEG